VDDLRTGDPTDQSVEEQEQGHNDAKRRQQFALGSWMLRYS
jgi:hypothetical protein